MTVVATKAVASSMTPPAFHILKSSGRSGRSRIRRTIRLVTGGPPQNGVSLRDRPATRSSLVTFRALCRPSSELSMTIPARAVIRLLTTGRLVGRRHLVARGASGRCTAGLRPVMTDDAVLCRTLGLDETLETMRIVRKSNMPPLGAPPTLSVISASTSSRSRVSSTSSSRHWGRPPRPPPPWPIPNPSSGRCSSGSQRRDSGRSGRASRPTICCVHDSGV